MEMLWHFRKSAVYFRVNSAAIPPPIPARIENKRVFR
jgi:hypothetical protein